jgi:predicted Zn-dependent protease
VSLLPWPVAAQVRLPDLGESAAEDFNVVTERRLGDQIMAELRRDPDYLDDPVLLDELQALWQPLVRAARQRGEISPDTDARFAWEAFLVRDRAVNAFALPGGYVGVHLGLIAIAQSRDELAAVLGHELSHVTQRHIARSIANSKRQSVAGLAALILGALVASRARSADGLGAVITGSQAAVAQGQLNFSRDMEREADRIGTRVMSDAGFSPAGVATMFEKLEQAFRLNDSQNYPYLRSHPLTTERIGEARARAGQIDVPPQSSPLSHAAMQARARVLMEPSVQALRRWQSLDAGPRSGGDAERFAALFASALASSRLRDHGRAQQAAAGAAEIAARESARDGGRTERAVRRLQAELALARGEGDAALSLLAMADDREHPRSQLLMKAEAARVAMRQGKADAGALEASANALRDWLIGQPADAGAWASLAQTAELRGQPVQSVRADAEARAAVGDYGGAVDRLRAAQRLLQGPAAADFIEASVVDARLRQLEAQRRAMATPQRP